MSCVTLKAAQRQVYMPGLGDGIVVTVLKESKLTPREGLITFFPTELTPRV